MIPVGVDIKKLDPRPKVIHELSQRSGRHFPIVRGIVFVKFGVYRDRNLVRQTMGRSEAIAKDYSGHETARYSRPIFDCYIAAVNQGLLLPITARVCRRATSEEGNEGLRTISIRVLVTKKKIQGLRYTLMYRLQ